MEERDIIVIGGGPGGYVAAIHAAHLGAKVALVEKDKLGGTCLNRGCIPTKALVRSAEVLLDIKRADEFGIDVNGASANFQKIMSRKRSVVDQLVSGVERLMTSNRISVHRGAARLTSPNSVMVNGEELHAKKVIVASGSESTLLPVPGVDLPGVLSTDDILELQEIPESLIVVGGSHVGVEFATIFNAMGTKVTIVERRPLQLEPVDEELGKRFAQTLPKQGITVKIGAAVKAVRKQGDRLKVVWDTPNDEDGVEAQLVLMATGRQPHTTGLGLAELGIKMDGKGIAVNDLMETSINNVYAIGDVLGKNMLAHVASYEGEIAAENALGGSRKADYRAVPTCVFTIPEVAGVGLTEKEAKEKGISYEASKFPFMVCGRAVAMGEAVGTVKVICEADTKKVLGMHIFGPHASDLIAEGVLAVQMEATAKDLAHTIHAHPTLPEAVMEAAMGQLHGAIHFQKL